MERKTDCIFRLKATKFDYSQGGCTHTDMDGFICTAFASEGEAVWMVGLPNGCFCEMYAPREKQPPTEKQIEVVHGEWVKDEEASMETLEAIYVCSACHNFEAWGETERYNYCPNCGAKMR